MNSEWVTLEWYECEQAIYVGARRESEALRQDIKAPQYSEQSSIENHMQSAGAERAVAKRLNLDWHASINTFHQGIPDVGGAIEVRYRRKKWDLPVRVKDHDDRFYVLVRGELPKYEIVGWIQGKQAKQPQFWKNPGNHEAAWFVPEDQLRPVAELLVSKVRLGEGA